MASFFHCFGFPSLQDLVISSSSFFEPRGRYASTMSYVRPKPKRLHDYALFTVRQDFTLRGFHVERVSEDPGKKCFDLTAKRGSVVLNLAVKGSTHLWDIPLLNPKSFDEERRLVANFL